MAESTDDRQAQIKAKVTSVLAETPFAVSSLDQLSGGTANFIYRASLKSPHPDALSGAVVVKQGEAYVATRPEFALAVSRCAVEQQTLACVQALPPVEVPAVCTISTPAVFFYQPDTCTQVQEYLPDAVSLKNYALEHYKAPTPGTLRPQCDKLGEALGVWLRSFHDWSDGAGHSEMKELATKNKEMQFLKLYVNYGSLAAVGEAHPNILGDIKEEMQAIYQMAQAEASDPANLGVIHGDFWSGNILLPNVPIEEGKQVPVKIIDWELVSLGVRPLDLGQMIAELWQLKLYKDIDAGEWLIKSFVRGYGAVDEAFAFRTIVHVGVHLICFGSRTPGWGTKEQAEDLVRTGKDILMKAWKKDRAGFKDTVLECLFGAI